jgi:hypothetical protein
MPLDSVQLRAQVDEYFSTLEQREERQKDPLSLSKAGEQTWDALSLLGHKHSNMYSEDYEQFSQALLSDKRFQRHLPVIAMNLLADDSHARLRQPQEHVPPNEGILQTKEAILSAAQNERGYDAVHRAAFGYIANNFDKFRNLDREDDSFLSVKYNSSNLTGSDLNIAFRDFRDYATSEIRIAANRNVLANFDKIDSSGNGAITHEEAASWLAAQPSLQCDQFEKGDARAATALPASADLCSFRRELTAALPKATSRQFSGSESITRESLSTRIDELRTTKTKFEANWGLRP